MGNDEPYTNIIYPWGSTPITNYLMSGDQMRLVLDGCAYSRTEKLAKIAKIPTVLRTLKVCWEGADTERNCGKCEKCIRTKLNFLAVGIPNPACFDEGLDISRILHMPLRNEVQLTELKSIHMYVQKHHVQGAWVDNLKKRIDAYGKRPGFLEHLLAGLKSRLASKT